MTAPDSIEGQIARAEGRRKEAEARLRELDSLSLESLVDMFQQRDVDLFGDELLSHGRNTVTVCKVGEKPFFGVNSNAPEPLYTDEDSSAAEQLRTRILEKLPA